MSASKVITDLLIDAGKGGREAHEDLVQRIYEELRILAQRYLRRERHDHTLQPTALVHEAYMRLVDQTRVEWKNRDHFFGIAACLMRRILVDHARKRVARKRGGNAGRVPITEIADLGVKDSDDLIAIDEALEKFAAFDPQKCRIVELRFFSGLTMEKIAGILDVSLGKVERDWRLARAWLYKELGKGNDCGSGSVEGS
jgi:RNA polymerase sigma-70 factor, ECF subfamily